MRHQSLRLAFVASLAFGGAVPALAFDIPDGQSCGGLVCDLGILGHTTSPAATAVPVFKAPTRPADAAAVPPPVKSAQPAPDVVRPAAPRKRVAKPAVPPSASPAVALRASSETVPVVAAPPPKKVRQAAPAVSTATMQNFAPAGMTMEDAAPALPAPQPRAEPVVLANPYVTDKPVPLAFQSVDPTVGAR